MNLIGFDTETWGRKPEYQLQPWRAEGGIAGITCFAHAWVTPEGKNRTRSVWFYDQPHIARLELERFLTYCAREQAHIVCWNAPFDIAWCLAWSTHDLVYANKWIDGSLIIRRIKNAPVTPTCGLKAVVSEYLPQFAGYETGVSFDPEDVAQRERLMKYCELDAAFARVLTQKFLQQLTLAERRNALIEAACLPMVAEANLSGLGVDEGHLATLDAHLEVTARGAHAELLAADPSISEMNLNSPDQVAKLLFEHWGLTPIKQTDGGKTGKVKPSTDKETLHELSFDHPLATVLRTNREALNNRTKFSAAIRVSLDYNKAAEGPTTYPQARVFGTYTGRMTYSSSQRKGKTRNKKLDYPIGFALHQMKRDPMFRRAIVPPPGHTLLEFDFAGQEYRWMAVESGDETMLQMCQPGEDGHTYMGARIGAMDYTDLQQRVAAGDKDAKLLRQLGKVGNLSCQYRTSAPRLRSVARVQYNIPMDTETSVRTHSTYRATYPGVPQYWKRRIAQCKQTRVVWTLAGRKVQLVGEWGWGLESTSINFPIQGVGGDQKYLALMVARNYLPQVQGRFYYELHDGLFFVVPDRHASKAASEMKRLLSNLPYERAWGVKLPIAFPVDAKIGKTWGDLQEWKG